MLREESHLSDQQLAMAADGELPASSAAAVRQHLAACWSCRERMREIEGGMADFAHLQRELDPKLPPIPGPRAVLHARLSALAAGSESSFASRAFGSFGRAYTLACAAVLCALAALLAVRFGALIQLRGLPPSHLEVAAVPKPQLTPGATVPVTKQQVCGSSSFTQGPVVPASLQQQVFEAYGISNPRSDAYEIDYLITPDLGGTANIRNLWPQPYSNTMWNARVKDQLEEHLHEMVCSGEIDLATAQHDLATDWVGAYKKYFRTDRPQLGPPKTHKRARQLRENSPSAEDPWQVATYTIPGVTRSRRFHVHPGSAM